MPHGPLLADLVAAAHDGDPNALARQRAAVVNVLGRPEMLEAAAVIANFSMMTRIADGTGTPLDAGTAAMSGEIRRNLDLDDLTSARL